MEFISKNSQLGNISRGINSLEVNNPTLKERAFPVQDRTGDRAQTAARRCARLRLVQTRGEGVRRTQGVDADRDCTSGAGRRGSLRSRLPRRQEGAQGGSRTGGTSICWCFFTLDTWIC